VPADGLGVQRLEDMRGVRIHQFFENPEAYVAILGIIVVVYVIHSTHCLKEDYHVQKMGLSDFFCLGNDPR
jgi:hypothetical protein